jgi:hypothetical protein
LITEASSALSRLEALRSAAEALKATKAGLEKVATTLNRWANLPEASDFVSEASVNIAKLQALTGFKSRYGAINAQCENLVQMHIKWAGLKAAETRMAAIAGASERLQILLSHRTRLAQLFESRIATENALAQHSKALTDARRQYVDSLIALGKCPVCGSSVDPSLIKEVA